MASLVSSNLDGSGEPSGGSATPIVQKVPGDKAEREDDEEDGEEDGIAQKVLPRRKRKRRITIAKEEAFRDSGSRRGVWRLYRLLRKYGQTEPPTKAVKDLFKNEEFPLGSAQKHGVAKYPCPDGGWQGCAQLRRKEKRETERPRLCEKVRHAAEGTPVKCDATRKASSSQVSSWPICAKSWKTLTVY